MPSNPGTRAPKPNKKRNWRRIGKYFAVILAVLLIARVTWGYRSHSQLTEQLSAIRKAGEPIAFADVTFESVPDEENAAYHLRNALSIWPKIDQEYVVDHDTYHDWLYENQADPVHDNRVYIEQCRQALTDVRHAANATKVDWGLRPTHPVWDMQMPYLADIRKLSHLLEDFALRLHDSGETMQSLEIAKLLIRLSAITGENPVCAAHAMAGRLPAAVSINLIAKVLPDIQSNDAQTRLALSDLIALLLDESRLIESTDDSLITQRWVWYSTAMGLLNEDFDATNDVFGYRPGDVQWADSPPLRWIVRPHFDFAIAVGLRQSTHTMERFRTTNNYADFKSALNPELHVLNGCPTSIWKYPLVNQVYYDLGNFIKYHYRHVANRRMTVAAIAIKLYEIDHQARPDSLDALVPGYLPALPSDPFAADGRGITYMPAGVSPKPDPTYFTDGSSIEPHLMEPYPLLYTLGSDLDDDLGKLIIDRDWQLSQPYIADGDQYLLLEPERKPVNPPQHVDWRFP